MQPVLLRTTLLGGQPMDQQSIKQELLQIRSQLLDLDLGSEESLKVSLEDEGGDESSDQHMGDVGTVTFTREMELSLHDNTEHLLAQVNRALEKMGEGTYGLCDRCGRPIEEARLRAIPYATRCMEHQRELERDLR